MTFSFIDDIIILVLKTFAYSDIKILYKIY